MFVNSNYIIEISLNLRITIDHSFTHFFCRNVTLLMVGLDGAGKTTIAKRLNGGNVRFALAIY